MEKKRKNCPDMLMESQAKSQKAIDGVQLREPVALPAGVPDLPTLFMTQKNASVEKYCYPILETGESWPLYLLKGAKAGPTLLITAGVHGGEYVGIETARRLAQTLNPEKIQGQVIFLPLVTAEAFYQFRPFVNPVDNLNLNRCFPGKPAGSLTEKIAWSLTHEFFPYADFHLDLHGGDLSEELVACVFVPNVGTPEVRAASRAMAEKLTIPYGILSTNTAGACCCAALSGVPSLLLERGHSGQRLENEIAAMTKNVLEVMQNLELFFESPSEPAETLCWLTEMVYLEVPSNGFWYPAKKAGDSFRAGDYLGHIETIFGEEIQRYTAPYDGVLLYQVQALGIQAGASLLAYGRKTSAANISA